MAEPKFEKDLERLEQIVDALETGGLPLDEALKRFEEGIKIAVRCEKALTDAERKVEILVKNAKGEIVAQPFGDDEGNVADAGAESPAGQEPAKEEEGGLLF